MFSLESLIFFFNKIRRRSILILKYFTYDERSSLDSASLLHPLVEGDGVGALRIAVRRVEDANIEGEGVERARGGGDFLVPFSGDVNNVLSCLCDVLTSEAVALGVDEVGMRS